MFMLRVYITADIRFGCMRTSKGGSFVSLHRARHAAGDRSPPGAADSGHRRRGKASQDAKWRLDFSFVCTRVPVLKCWGFL